MAGGAPARTLVVLHVGDPSGPSITLGDSLAWLSSMGEVEVLVPWGGSAVRPAPDPTTLTVARYETLTFPTGPRSAVHAVRRFRADVRMFRDHIRRTRPELVVVATSVLPAALLAARRERVPSVVYLAELFGKPTSRGPVRSLAGRMVVRASAALADASICCSASVAAQLPAGSWHSTRVLYPAIARRPAAPGARERFRAAHGIAPDATVLMLVGNVSRGRGHDLVVRAAAQLRADVPAVACAFVGQPHRRPVDLAFRREVDALAGELGLGDRVHWCGYTAAVADAFAAADVVVNPTRHPEPFGRVALEALAAGRPVVGARIGAMAEVLRDGRDVLLVAPESPDEIASAVLRLTREPGLAEALVAQGGARVRARFRSEDHVTAFAGVVASVLR